MDYDFCNYNDEGNGKHTSSNFDPVELEYTFKSNDHEKWGSRRIQFKIIATAGLTFEEIFFEISLDASQATDALVQANLNLLPSSLTSV